MKALISLLLACAVAGCATPPPPTIATSTLLRDAAFAPSTETIDAGQVMALNDEMRAYLRRELGPQLRSNGTRQGLLDALYTKSQLKLEYDTAMTRTAAEAFEARAGNCLSLTLMTAAFAKELGLPVHYQNVLVDELWSRVGNLQFVAGHVNLRLGRRHTEFKVYGDEAENLIVDFMPGAQIRSQRSLDIDESVIVAMYMNNRAAESLSEGKVDQAYWWARAAVLHEPRYLGGINTLGVIYRRHGELDAAARAFREVLQREPANTPALANLVVVLRETGQADEADRLNLRLAEIQPYPPFMFYDQGREAMRAGDFKRARDLFNREIARNAYFHELHFWLALANYALGDMVEVRRELTLAKDNSTTLRDRELYSAKLDSLRVKRSY